MNFGPIDRFEISTGLRRETALWDRRTTNVAFSVLVPRAAPERPWFRTPWSATDKFGRKRRAVIRLRIFGSSPLAPTHRIIKIGSGEAIAAKPQLSDETFEKGPALLYRRGFGNGPDSAKLRIRKSEHVTMGAQMMDVNEH
jgi:hypothetical protein